MSNSLVADLMQAPRINGKYAKEQALLVRKSVKIPRDIFDRINSEFEQGHNGLFYKEDAKATKEREKKQAENRLAREEKSQLEKVSLADVVAGVVAKEKTKKDETKES